MRHKAALKAEAGQFCSVSQTCTGLLAPCRTDGRPSAGRDSVRNCSASAEVLVRRLLLDPRARCCQQCTQHRFTNKDYLRISTGNVYYRKSLGLFQIVSATYQVLLLRGEAECTMYP